MSIIRTVRYNAIHRAPCPHCPMLMRAGARPQRAQEVLANCSAAERAGVSETTHAFIILLALFCHFRSLLELPITQLADLCLKWVQPYSSPNGVNAEKVATKAHFQSVNRPVAFRQGPLTRHRDWLFADRIVMNQSPSVLVDQLMR